MPALRAPDAIIKTVACNFTYEDARKFSESRLFGPAPSLPNTPEERENIGNASRLLTAASLWTAPQMPDWAPAIGKFAIRASRGAAHSSRLQSGWPFKRSAQRTLRHGSNF
jgi:hypothetical protein